MSIRIERSNGSTCTPFSVDDELIAFGEAPFHSIDCSKYDPKWEGDHSHSIDCSKYNPKWEGDHLKIPMHFGEDRLAMERLQRVNIEEVLLPVHFQFGERVMTPQLGMIQQVHANMKEIGQE